MARLIFAALICVGLTGCIKPVNVIVVAPGQMRVVQSADMTHLIIAKDLLKGKPVKNTITQEELRDILNSNTIEVEKTDGQN